MTIENTSGLKVDFLDSGSIKAIYAGSVMIGMKETTPYSLPAANIYMRIRNANKEFIPLTGPKSKSQFRFEKRQYVARGSWNGLAYCCSLYLAKEGFHWQWHVEVTNTTRADIALDFICLQDVGLKAAGSAMVNAYYVSQYVERLVLDDDRYGKVICCRQNMKEAGKNPWLMMACKQGALSAATDGMQFYGKRYRMNAVPEGLLLDSLPGECAGESSVVALQQKPFTLQPGHTHHGTFLFAFREDHPQATSSKDLQWLSSLIHSEQYASSQQDYLFWQQPVKSLFQESFFLPCVELSDEEIDLYFGKHRNHSEEANGKLLSFFGDNHQHVVLSTKELLTDRPHGHIMQANVQLIPHEGIMSSNTFAYGVFNAHLTQGNTNFNGLLSVCSDPLNMERYTGQRIFVRFGNDVMQLGVPSAFEMGFNHCRWIYKYDKGTLLIRTWTSLVSPQVNLDVQVLSGPEPELIITHHFDPLNQWDVEPAGNPREFFAVPSSESMIRHKFPYARFRFIVHTPDSVFHTGGPEQVFPKQKSSDDLPLFVFRVKSADHFCMSIVGEVNSSAQAIAIHKPNQQFSYDTLEAQRFWSKVSLGLSIKSNHPDISAISGILPWYGLNALIHYLTPYGLEQFGGAAWGTRDVSQGPIDMLLHLGKYDEAREVLCTIFSNQHPDGGWPQWWMFDSYAHIRADEAHGDITYWCILALALYIKITGDDRILDEDLPYFDKSRPSDEKTPILEHLDRLVDMITRSFIPGTTLVPFGGGDWNDSLQPVSKELAGRLISSWTVQMNYQAFSELITIYNQIGQHTKANDLESICVKIKNDFNRYLIKDDVVAGYGLLEKDGRIRVILHPSDTKTGIHYSVLPMNRGIISNLFSPQQASHHQQLIEKHLTGPDGVRLMDKPLPYSGGKQNMFQRAESSTFFGREIGLMYTHEHIRYAEALAITGKPEAFVKALRQALPIGYQQIVPPADYRQSNCYYSSSDVVFQNRYQASERYQDIIQGRLPLKGGWRVYSSGPGIFIGLIMARLLGLRINGNMIVFDPVMPSSMDGLSASLELAGFPVRLSFYVPEKGYGVRALTINGESISFKTEPNPYRKGGAIIGQGLFIKRMKDSINSIEIETF